MKYRCFICLEAVGCNVHQCIESIGRLCPIRLLGGYVGWDSVHINSRIGKIYDSSPFLWEAYGPPDRAGYRHWGLAA
jgi:hypothetical protein